MRMQRTILHALNGTHPIALRRVWHGVRFSWWMTNLLHDFGEHEVNGMDAKTFRRFMDSERDFYLGNEEGRRILAMQYVGLPYEDPLATG